MRALSSVWQDRGARRLLTGALWLAAGLCLWGLAGGWLAALGAGAARRELLEGLAAGLLEQGLTPGQAAAALTRTAPSEAGRQLLAQMGLARPRWPAWGWAALGAGLAAGLVPAAVMLAGCARWLCRREEVCRARLQLVRRCAAGDPAARLPWDEGGTPGLLWQAVDELAAALRAGQAREHRGREFLKATMEDISHQLKTPLAALALYDQILLDDPADAGAVARFAAKSAAAVDRMTRLVQTLLRLASLDAGGIAFAPAPCPLDRLAADAAEPLTARAAAEGKTLTLAGPPGAAVLCDPAWTGEAVGNLIKNALDHTGPGGHVAVRWGTGPLGGWLTVTDDGPGIPARDIHHIFKRFYLGSAPRGEGLGLGLPFARTVLEAQGGGLQAESEEGRGAVFTAFLPAAPPGGQLSAS